MSEDSKTCTRENLSQAYRAVAKKLSEGNSAEAIVQDLVKGNWPESSAKRIVQSVEQSLQNSENKLGG